MKRVLAVAGGAVAGVLLAGVIVPVLTMIAPPQLRGPAVVWGTAIVVVLSVTAGCWWLSSSGAD